MVDVFVGSLHRSYNVQYRDDSLETRSFRQNVKVDICFELFWMINHPKFCSVCDHYAERRTSIDNGHN
jgi:hypothetical protein